MALALGRTLGAGDSVRMQTLIAYVIVALAAGWVVWSKFHVEPAPPRPLPPAIAAKKAAESHAPLTALVDRKG